MIYEPKLLIISNEDDKAKFIHREMQHKLMKIGISHIIIARKIFFVKIEVFLFLCYCEINVIRTICSWYFVKFQQKKQIIIISFLSGLCFLCTVLAITCQIAVHCFVFPFWRKLKTSFASFSYFTWYFHSKIDDTKISLLIKWSSWVRFTLKIIWYFFIYFQTQFFINLWLSFR